MTYDTKSLDTTARSLETLEAIREHGGLSLSRLATELDISKSTAHKHLITLKRKGYVVKDADQYRVGLKFLHFSEYARVRKRGYRLAAEMVDQLAERTGGEVDFIAESDGKGITVYESYDRDNPYNTSSDEANNHWRAGTYYYLHSIAAGKAILSAMPKDRVERILNRHGLPASTDQTITDREELDAELDRIREQGYAVSQEEYTEGLSAIACAVSAVDGTTLGAFGVSVPTYRMREPTFKSELQQKLQTATEEFEAELADD